MTLLMMSGLPASGKTTAAKELVAQGWVRVNKDDLRAMLNGGKWSKENENRVLTIRNDIVSLALKDGRNVVVDDTNFNPEHEEQLQKIAGVYKSEFKTKFFDTPLDECIKRDAKRVDSVGKDVIMKMYNQYLRPTVIPMPRNPDLPDAILCDIDGTLGHGIGVTRKPYEWDKVGTDTVDPIVADLLHRYLEKPIILLSGRDASCRKLTEQWLEENSILCDKLLMRPEGDNRNDAIVKRELYDQFVKDKYNVLFVLDDRPRVIRMWESLGLKVLHCGTCEEF